MKRILIYLFPFFGIISCMIERDSEPTPAEVEQGEHVNTTFSLLVPGQSMPVVSKAMDDAAENYLKSIYVLAFKVDEDGNEMYDYLAEPKDFSPTTEKEVSFTVTLHRSKDAYRFVVLTNCAEQLTKLNLRKGTTKKEMLSGLIYENESLWLANGTNVITGDFTPIPMWGESELMTIEDGSKISGLKLIRMLARIDVALATGTVKDQFKLKSVRVYNRRMKGLVVPDPANVDSARNKVVRASMPPGDPDDYTLKYPGTNISYSQNDSSLTQEIYITESVAGTTMSEVTCLVVGGIYKGDLQETYYRLDFFDPSDGETYIDILRNHRYVMTINSVDGSGHETPDLAYNARPVNMNAEILVWDEADMNDVIFDGQYMLSVNKSVFNLAKEGKIQEGADQSNLLKVYTDYPAGWKISQIIDTNTNSQATWLTVSQESGNADENYNIILRTTDNTTGNTRSAKIYIAAGRLNHLIKVDQSVDSEYSLRLTDENDKDITELVFPSGIQAIDPVQAKSYYVKWNPAEEDCVAEVLSAAIFEFGVTSDVVTSGTLLSAAGVCNYSIIPTPMTRMEVANDPFKEKVTKITYSLGSGSTSLSRSITLKQIHYNLLADVASMYDLDGQTKTFYVRSNVEWKASVYYNGGVIENTITTTGVANTNQGTLFTFKATQATSLTDYYAIIRFESIAGKFDDKYIQLNFKSN